MSGESRQADSQNSPGNTRIDQLRGMDGGAAVAAAEGGRRAKRGVLDRRGRCGRSKGRIEHSTYQGDGRLYCVLRAKWRANPSTTGVSTTVDGSRIRRHLSDQIFEAHQGRGPLLHDL